MTHDYWLSQWLDANGIKSPSDLKRALRSESVHEAAIETAFAAQSDRKQEYIPDPARVVAGAHMDLSDNISCNNLECLWLEVEMLFATFGHYFDSIVVEGLGPHRFFWRYRDSLD